MSSETTKTFKVVITRSVPNGLSEMKEFKKLNHAVRFLWKSRGVLEGFLTIMESDKTGLQSTSYKLLAKVGRRRGIITTMCLTSTVPVMRQRPPMKKAGENWHRLPNRFNDIK
jgi:hypothetical protein